ncbi:MAG TPA: hypothetical protein DEH78_32885 [Solibacterales bacterium]|nr:hypothetical protein [Bryobacterales bacterium]
MKFTRREAALALIAAAPAAAPAQGQTPAPAANDELAAARELFARNADALLKYEVAIATEPAFVFRAL